MTNKVIAVTRKLKVIGGSLDRNLQDDGTTLTSERVNVRAEDGTCEMQLIVSGDGVGVFEIGSYVKMVLSAAKD